jgi:hypothetical protein
VKPFEIERAADAVRDMKRADEIICALCDFYVVGITLNRDETGAGTDVKLNKHTSGTGSVVSIGYPKDLQEHMTHALNQWAENRLKKAREDAKAYGVDID